MCGTLILSYISRFCPFLEIQNFELHFLLGGGGGGWQEIRKINMFGDMMKLRFIFCTFWGVISINLGLFKVYVQIWKML